MRQFISVVPTPAPLILEVVDTESGFDGLEVEWRGLYERSEFATSPLKWEWMREWWRIFGSPLHASNRLHIITFRRAHDLVGILPLYLQVSGLVKKRTLRFISTGEKPGEITYPEYLSILLEHALSEDEMKVLADYLQHQSLNELGWDEIDLGILSAHSPLSGLAQSIHHRIPLLPEIFTHTCLQADISGGLQEYVKRLPQSSQKQTKRILKQKALAGISFKVATTEAEAHSFFSDLVSLHQSRWLKKDSLGAFSSSRIIDFHRKLISTLLPRNELMICKLSMLDRPIAMLYGFISKRKFDFYQSGIDITTEDLNSPGIFAHLLNMEHLAERGVLIYDFLAGVSSYKERLSTKSIQVPAIRITRPTLRVKISNVHPLIMRARQKLRKLIGV